MLAPANMVFGAYQHPDPTDLASIRKRHRKDGKNRRDQARRERKRLKKEAEEVEEETPVTPVPRAEEVPDTDTGMDDDKPGDQPGCEDKDEQEQLQVEGQNEIGTGALNNTGPTARDNGEIIWTYPRVPGFYTSTSQIVGLKNTRGDGWGLLNSRWDVVAFRLLLVCFFGV